MIAQQVHDLMNSARANAKAQFLMDGGDMEKAMQACASSHKLPELTLERCVYVGAYMDTIHRLAQS